MAGRPAGVALLGRPGEGIDRLAKRSKIQDGPPPPKLAVLEVCELGHREANRFTVHHLVPRARGGKFGPKARLCPTCHRQLHAMFSEATLAKELSSIESLRANPEVSSYLKWARRQQGPASFKVRRANNRR